MAEISYRRHRFPPAIIQHAVWVYLRFALSYRDVEELLAERGPIAGGLHGGGAPHFAMDAKRLLGLTRSLVSVL